MQYMESAFVPDAPIDCCQQIDAASKRNKRVYKQ